MNKGRISYKKFNPNFHHLKLALSDDTLRFIFLYGGSSSAKSYSCAQTFLLECLTNGVNTMVFKKVGSTIAESIYKSFQEAAKQLNIYHLFNFKINKIECFNGSYITFKGLDESEKIKGLESYKYVLCEELSDFDEADFKQIRKRLRGKKGQKIISTFNPISKEHWIKKNVFDKEVLNDIDTSLFGKLKDNYTGEVLTKEYSEVTRKQLNSERTVYNPRTKKDDVHPPDMLIIKSTYLNNFWVVSSPCGTYGFYDRQTIADFIKDKERDIDYYNIYALGEWGNIRTGGEYLHAFNTGIHRKKTEYIEALPVHVVVDNNVLPYISVSFWQINNGELRQFHEICAEEPLNTVSKAGEAARTYLENIGYNDIVFLYGDASTKAGNTIDDEKRSFLDKFEQKLEESFIVENRVPDSNPSVSMTGEFVNSILFGTEKGLSISIDDSCTKSIDDYENVKKDVNGGILKVRIKNKLTQQTYEQYGHLTDCLRYVVVGIFKEEYIRFSLRRKRNSHKKEYMQYFNSDSKIEYKKTISFVMPDCNGKFLMAKIGIHEHVDVLDAVMLNSLDTGSLDDSMKDRPDYYVFECAASYFPMIREMREKGADVKGMKEKADKFKRISANEQFIKEKFRFKSDYDNVNEYASFMENMMDYNGKERFEAINLLSMAATHIQRNYFN